MDLLWIFLQHHNRMTAKWQWRGISLVGQTEIVPKQASGFQEKSSATFFTWPRPISSRQKQPKQDWLPKAACTAKQKNHRKGILWFNRFFNIQHCTVCRNVFL